MTPFTAPDPQLSKMHRRAQMRMVQAFQLFMIQIAHGSKPKDAISTIDEAMEFWTNYEDRYETENPLPDMPDPTGAMIANFQQVMAKMGENADKIGAGNAQLYAIHPRDIIEASRDMARASRDMLAAGLESVLPVGSEKLIAAELQARMNLVMDCFNTGAAMMLKMLHGDARPEPWSDNYDHEERIAHLLSDFGLLCEHDNHSAPASTDPPGQANGGSHQ